MKSTTWNADIAVTEEIAQKCIARQFPALLPFQHFTCLGEGWDNIVFLVNQTVIFRFPRRKLAVDLLNRENKILKSLALMLNLDIPLPLYFGIPSDDYPYPFSGYTFIPGASGCTANLSREARQESIIPLALFLKKLHAINAKKAEFMRAEAQLFDRTVFPSLRQTLEERINLILEKNISQIEKTVFYEEMQKAEKITLPLHDKCLVHGDLYCRHLIFNQQKLTAIIDWGDTGINNPAVDLAVIWSFYPEQMHSQFFEIYGHVEKNSWNYARFLGLYSAFTLLLYGHETGDVCLKKEALDSLQRINPYLLMRH